MTIWPLSTVVAYLPLDTYKRAARTFEELNLGALAPMNEAIPELRERDARPTSDDGNGSEPAHREDSGPITLGPDVTQHSLSNPGEIPAHFGAPVISTGYVEREKGFEPSTSTLANLLRGSELLAKFNHFNNLRKQTPTLAHSNSWASG
jgi:hypothetical protein